MASIGVSVSVPPGFRRAGALFYFKCSAEMNSACANSPLRSEIHGAYRAAPSAMGPTWTPCAIVLYNSFFS